MDDFIITYRSDSIFIGIKSNGELGIWRGQSARVSPKSEDDTQWYRIDDIFELRQTSSISSSRSHGFSSGPSGSASSWSKSETEKFSIVLLIENHDGPLLLPLQDKRSCQELQRVLEEAKIGKFPGQLQEFVGSYS